MGGNTASIPMKTNIPFLLLAASALTFVSCTSLPHTARLQPMRDVEAVERQAQVTPNTDIGEALNARTAANYGSGRRFGGGFGGGFGF